MHTNKVSTKHVVFEQVQDQDKIHVNLQNITADINIDGKVSLLHFIPIVFKSAKASDIVVDMVLEAPSADGMSWEVKEDTKITLGSLEITLDSGIW